MYRIWTTLDSVSKAVGSTDLIAKISRLKPSGAVAGASCVKKAPELLVKAESVTTSEMALTTTSAAAASETTTKPPEEEQKGVNQGESEEPSSSLQVTEKPFVVARKPKPSLVSAASASAASSSSNMAKQTLQLFHPATLSANMDETYSALAQHVNNHFNIGPQTPRDDDNYRLQQCRAEKSPADEPILNQGPPTTEHVPVLVPIAEAKSVETTIAALTPPTPENTNPPIPTPSPDSPVTDTVPVPVTSPKKGFSHYLSDPRPSVQAFVGSYISPLVPKFRADSKSAIAEKDKPPLPALEGSRLAKAVEKRDSEEEKAEDKAKKLLLSQREKIIARVSVDNRTRALVKGLQRVTDMKLLTSRVDELGYHLLEYPETRGVAIKENVLPCLLRLRQARDPALQDAVREALALVGYNDPVKGRGIRVLAIDGGGTRGLVALQTLHKLQKLTGKPIYQLFDYICGVSTGAILALMLGVFQIPLDECEEMYLKLGTDVFKQNVIVGTMKMGWNHAFYNSEIWENLLKERMGERLMVESARDPNCPKVSAVSTLVNRGLPLKAYVFRNYRMLPGVRSHYLGDCNHKMWQAIRASSAAPGYFQEFVLGKDLHQDGGLLINNPTALAIHECKCLWPNTPVQCVVSLGTGRHETAGKNSATYTSLKTKLTNVISSATDTEEVHTMLDALLPPDTYFRFNPYMSEEVPLDESRPERLNYLKGEGERYLERNHAKLRMAASVLSQEKSAIQRLAEWAKLKAEMYEGLPFSSKL